MDGAGFWRAVYGISRRESASTGPNSRSGAVSSSPSAPGGYATRTETTYRPRRCGGSAGMSGYGTGRKGRGQPLRHGPRPLLVRPQQDRRIGLPPVEGDRTAVQRPHGYEADLQLGDDAEVVAAAEEGPVQAGVGLPGHLPEPAVGGDHVQGAHMVGRVAELPGQDAQPAAQCVGDGPDARGGAVERCEAVRLGGRHDLPPADARPDSDGTGLGVD